MPSRPFALIHGVRHWTDTETNLCKRFEAHLIRRRAARVAELLALREAAPPLEEQLPLPLGDPEFDHVFEPPRRPEPTLDVQLTWQQKRRITERVRKLLLARAAAGGLSHLKEADRQLILSRLPGVRLGGPETEHAAHELAAALVEEIPWMRQAIEHIWRGACRSAREGLGLGFGPILLVGPPAAGKSHLARRTAELAGVPLVTVDLGAGSDGFRLAGVTRGWGTATPGRPVEEILASGLGNPVCLVDELDTGGTVTSSGGTVTSAWNALLGLLEPGSASAWECPYYRLKFNLGRICWVLTANDARWLPAPLLSRLTIVRVRRPSPEELAAVALREGARRGIDPKSLEILADAIRRAGEGVSLRQVMRLLDELCGAEERMALH